MSAPQAPFSVEQALLGPVRWRATHAVVALGVLSLPLWLGSHALLANEIAIVALFAVSLDLVLGYSGIVTLGHAAFFGFGAYSAALFAKHLHPDPLLGLAVGGLSALLLGAVCALSILRGSDLTRLMVTLATSFILLEGANKWDELTGGADGLQGVIMGPLLGRFEFDLYGQVAAAYSLTVLTVVVLVLRRVVHAPLGLTWQALRDNPLRAQAVGVSVHRELARVYTLAAGIAGLAGALMAQTTGFASLDVFALERSADAVLMLVMGGTGWLYGGVLGAVAFKLLHDLISNLTPQYWTFWMGLILVTFMLVGRERLWQWITRRGRGA